MRRQKFLPPGTFVVILSPGKKDLLEVVLIKDERGFWSLPGGRIDPGETPTTAARREALHKAGFCLGKAEYVGVFELQNPRGVVHLFCVELDYTPNLVHGDHMIKATVHSITKMGRFVSEPQIYAAQRLLIQWAFYWKSRRNRKAKIFWQPIPLRPLDEVLSQGVV